MIPWMLALITSAAAAPTLDDVLVSVRQHFPLIVAAEAERDAAEAAQREARGGFDPGARIDGWYKTGPYDQGFVGGRLSQATPLYGLSLGAGYRIGLGDFADYDGWYDTKDGGEVFVDATLPLLKGGLTDDLRTDILVADAERAEAIAMLLTKQVESVLKARSTWWKWVGAGSLLAIAERRQSLAVGTFDATVRRIEQGDLPEISEVDARRVLVQREGELLQATRNLEAASYGLGLFLRDADGRPRALQAVRPDDTLRDPDTALPTIDDAVAVALGRRPELDALRATREAAVAKRRLARVSLLPKLDLKVELRQDLSPEGGTAEPFDAKVGGVFDVALLQRAARGKREAAEAKVRGIDAKLQFAQETVTAEVRTAHATVTAALAQARLADEQAVLAARIEEATRIRYREGDTDLFSVYLREQSALKAAQERIYAWVTYHVARAELDAAMGMAWPDATP